MIVFSLKLHVIIKTLIILSTLNVYSSSTYPTCGNCWCIPDENGTASCPTDWIPQMTFEQEIIDAYLNMLPSSVYTLGCNPYYDITCSTSPPQDLLNVSSSVCAYKYNLNCNQYSMVTYESEAKAADDGAIITHAGSCGLCSTAQDLSVYLVEDFTNAGKKCSTIGLLNETAGLECFMDIGLTRECAKIWNYDGIYDGKVCTESCIGHLTEPNNGPPPECELNECLQCDEDNAGPIFSSFAGINTFSFITTMDISLFIFDYIILGRTRRRSGLLSEIIRPCESIAHIEHIIPCSYTSTLLSSHNLSTMREDEDIGVY